MLQRKYLSYFQMWYTHPFVYIVYEYETNFKHEPTLIGLKFLAV